MNHEPPHESRGGHMIRAGYTPSSAEQYINSQIKVEGPLVGSSPHHRGPFDYSIFYL